VNEAFGAAAGTVLVGHRGGRGAGWPPENTLAAFARAHEEGAVAVELDVRPTRDGRVVVFHDATLERMTGGLDRRRVADMTRADLVRVRLTSPPSAGPVGELVPELDEVLDWAHGRTAVNVEVKRDVPDRVGFARSVARVLERHPGVEVLLSSFDPALLAALAALAPRVPRAWLAHEGQRRWEPVWSRAVSRAPIFAVHIERTLANPATLESLRASGKRVGVWTVNDAGEARDLALLGVDWLITDGPGALRGALFPEP